MASDISTDFQCLSGYDAFFIFCGEGMGYFSGMGEEDFGSESGTEFVSDSCSCWIERCHSHFCSFVQLRCSFAFVGDSFWRNVFWTFPFYSLLFCSSSLGVGTFLFPPGLAGEVFSLVA